MAFIGVLGFAFGILMVLAVVFGVIYGMYLNIKIWFGK